MKYALVLVPLSMIILNFFRYTQYFSEHGITLDNVLDKLPITFHFKVPGNQDHLSPYTCVPHDYSIELLSIDPLVIYINNFLRDEEIEHLLELGFVFPYSPLSEPFI